jgi:DNA repair protein RadC
MSDDLPHYHGHRDRLRARFVEVGGDALPDYELLELVLFRSIPRRDVKPIAKELLKRFGTFAEVLAASPARLVEVDGIGESVVTDLKIVEASAGRLAKGEVAKRPVLSSWSSVLDYCRTAMAFMDKEQFRLLFSTSATLSSPTRCSNRAPSITPRSIRARWSNGPSNSPLRP